MVWVLVKIIRGTIRLLPKKEAPVKEPVQVVEENEWIKWHLKKEDNKKKEASMNAALQSMNEARADRRKKQFHEYLKWCIANKKTPVFNDHHGLDHVL